MCTVRWLNGMGRVLLGAHGEPLRALRYYAGRHRAPHLEDQFQQAPKMEAIGRLAGGVAHDFKQSADGDPGLLRPVAGERNPDDPRQRDIAEIQKAGQRGAGFTRQLLTFSRKQIIQPTLLDLNVVVTAMRAMLGRLIGEDCDRSCWAFRDLALVMVDRG